MTLYIRLLAGSPGEIECCNRCAELRQERPDMTVAEAVEAHMPHMWKHVGNVDGPLTFTSTNNLDVELEAFHPCSGEPS